MCIQTTKLTNTMFNFKDLGSYVTVIRSNPELLLTLQRTKSWIPSVYFTILLSLASRLLTAKAEWISLIVHSLQIAFGWRFHRDICLGCGGIDEWDTGTIFKKFSRIEENIEYVMDEYLFPSNLLLHCIKFLNISIPKKKVNAGSIDFVN